MSKFNIEEAIELAERFEREKVCGPMAMVIRALLAHIRKQEKIIADLNTENEWLLDQLTG